jgi:beta-glucosidase
MALSKIIMALSRRQARKLFSKRAISVLLASLVIATALPLSPPSLAAEESIVFKTAPAGDAYAGLPLFDGNPAHVEQYLDTFVNYIGLDGMIRFAMDQRGDYLLRNTATFSSTYVDTSKRGVTVTWTNPNAGKRIPGAAQFAEGVQGLSTDFPAQVGMAQSWNKDLLNKIGTVIGNEKLDTINYKSSNDPSSNSNQYLSAVNIMLSAALSDIRINPLSGRIDESYSEDPYLAAVMLNASAQGISGTALPESNGFWQKAFVDTKHFSNYIAQWMRTMGSQYNSARGLTEYVARSTYKGFESGAVSAMMTSYGRTNSIPNAMSPMIEFVKSLSKYRIYTLNDNGAETAMSTLGSYGNGYDRNYAPYRVDQLLWQTLANASGGHQQNTNYPGIHDNEIALIDAIQSGKYGIKADDFKEIAKSQILVLVRNGVLNERDANNLPINYPFANKIYQNTGKTSAGQNYNYTTPENQQIALQAAQESVVLLKNEGNVLPLAKNANFVVAGGLADFRSKTTYSATTPTGPAIGLSPLGGIATVTGKSVSQIKYTSAGKKIVLKANNGKYLTVAANNTVTATGVAATTPAGSYFVSTTPEAAVFEVYPWGQADSASLRVVGNTNTAQNGRWLQNGASASTAASGSFEVSGMTSGFASSVVSPLRREYQTDGRVRYVSGTFGGGFGGGFETAYYGSGRYLSLTDSNAGALGQTALLGSVTTAGSLAASTQSLRTNDTLFTEEVVKQAGEEVSTGSDYAVVVVGTGARHSQGEGTDRIDTDLGREQYELVKNVADKYPGKTIVVLKTSSQVMMQEIQQNPKVASVVYQPYAGEYDGYALGQVLFGDCAPTGRLTATWYADMSALPAITKYSIGEGVERNVASTGTKLLALNDLDPYYKVEMNDGDPVDTKLTYMYTDATVTYPFGYGLSYSNFAYSNLQVPGAINAATGKFNVSVDVANTGSVNTSDVAQLYISANNSPYGQYAPKKQLISFEKVALNAGEKKTVTLEVDPADIAIWNTNKSKLAVINGDYTFSVGRSSQDIKLTSKSIVYGEELGTLDAATKPIDVFASSFASSHLTYREVSRQGTMDSLKADNVTSGFYSVMSKERGAWAGLKNVYLTGSTKLTLKVATNVAAGDIQIHLDSPTGPLLAVTEVPATNPVTYKLTSSDVSVTELGYTNVDANFLTNVSGTRDVYIVFREPDLRVATLSVNGNPPPSGGESTGGSTDSDNSGSSGTTTPTTTTTPATITTGTSIISDSATKVTATVTGNSASATVTKETITKAGSLVISSPIASITLDKAALSAISGVAGGDVKISAVKVDKATLPAAVAQTIGDRPVFDFTITSGNTTISSFGGGKATVSVPYELKTGENPNAVVVYFLDDSGKMTMVQGVYKNGTVQMELSHFSKYVIGYNKISFTDVTNQWYAPAVDFIAAREITGGVGNNLFAPDAVVKRGEFITILCRAYGIAPKTGDNFADAGNTYYTGYLAAAKQLSISGGVGDNKFAPEMKITREEMFTLLYNALKALNELPTANSGKKLSSFSDSGAISTWANDAMKYFVENGVVAGSNSKLTPKDSSSRGQMAQVFYNMMSR